MAQPTKKVSAFPQVTSCTTSDFVPIIAGGVASHIHTGEGGGLDAGLHGGQTRRQQVPAGSIMEFAGISEPSGWFLCIGTAKARATYADLYAALTAAKGTFTVTMATPAVFTLNAHGLATGDCVELTTTGDFYTGLTANTNYFVIWIDANTFNLATTLANALAGTKIATSGDQSGVHSLRYCPWGISGADDFLLPDKREASGYGIGTRGAEVTAHDSPVLGQFEDDQLQGHYTSLHGTLDTVALSGGAVSIGRLKSSGAAAPSATTNIGGSPATDYVNGTPRTGTVTRGKIIGVNFIIKY